MEIFRNYQPAEFENEALEIFRMQVANVPVYRDFVSNLGILPERVKSIRDIPFLPVELFKEHRVIATDKEPELIFQSSGTIGQVRSKHYVADKNLYDQSLLRGFKYFYGSPADYIILALLPSYLERNNASLVYMVKKLMDYSRHPGSGFFLHDYAELFRQLKDLRKSDRKVMLIGVSFALLDLAEHYSDDFSMHIFMETGGMKGRREEITREELHNRLMSAFNIFSVHSEYGMTELLSQAYSLKGGNFYCPPWMKILIRDSHDPFHYPETGAGGLINIIDLANIHSCSFIATSDIGKYHDDGSFEVLGRMDNTDIRGCNLLVN